MPIISLKETKMQLNKHNVTSIISFSFLLVWIGILMTILLMATAWIIYPGEYDWLNRDLSTMGRFFTVNGHGFNTNYQVYNFALLFWGFSGALFCVCRAALLSRRKQMLIWAIVAPCVGIGTCTIGIVPADAPNMWIHCAGSALGIITLAIGIFSLNSKEEPGKKYWCGAAILMLVAKILFKTIDFPHCYGAILQKTLVLYIFVYLLDQSWRLRRGLKTHQYQIAWENFPTLRKISAITLIIAIVAALLFILSAMACFPGGFNWHHHWTSILGHVFLTKEISKQAIYPYYMLYNLALNFSGISLALFWCIRARYYPKASTGIIVLIFGMLSGIGLCGIGMAPMNMLGLHRWSINIFSISLCATLLLEYVSDCHNKCRLFWLLFIPATAIIFFFLGHHFGKLAQKILIIEAFCWYITLSFSSYYHSQKQI
jgi:hypothetical protein